MNTYTLIITWNIPFCNYRWNEEHTMDSYAAAQKQVDAVKTSSLFISAFIKKNSK